MKLIKEIIRQHLTETGNKKLNLTFNPPLIPGSAEYDVYIDALQKEFPTLVWASGTPVAGSTRFLPKNSVGNLIIRYHDGRHLLSWSDPGSYYLGIDAAEWLSSTQDFDTGDAFESLYESEDSEKGVKLEDGTSIVFPYDYRDEDVYEILHWLIQNGWVKGYEDTDLKQILYELSKPWNKGKRRPFFMLRKVGSSNEPTVYWAPTGDLSRDSKTFSKVINAEDLLTSISTDFFITESDDSLEWAEDLFKSIPELPKVDGQRRVVRTKGELTEDYVMIILQLLTDNGYYFGSGNSKSMAYQVTEVLNNGGYLNLHPNGKLSYGYDEESLNQAYDVYYSELPNIFI